MWIFEQNNSIDVHSTLSLILYKTPYHRLLLVHLFIYHLIARPTMGNYYIYLFVIAAYYKFKFHYYVFL